MGWFWDPFSGLASLAIDKIGTAQLNQWPKSAWNMFVQSLKEAYLYLAELVKPPGSCFTAFLKSWFLSFFIRFWVWSLVRGRC